MLQVVCDRCGKASKEFFSYEHLQHLSPVVTFLENEGPWCVDFAASHQFVFLHFPGPSSSGEDRQMEWKTICPECIEEFWKWFKKPREGEANPPP